MLNELAEYDWKEAFAFAGESGGCNSGGVQAVPMGANADLSPVSREDVKRIVAMAEGENDGLDWVGLFELHDGRFLTLRAGCDYTGWD